MISDGEQPPDHERQERQLEDVEADVAPEQRVDLRPEVDRVVEQDPLVPHARRAGAGDEGEGEGHEDPHEALAVPDELAVAVDDLVLGGVGRVGRGRPVGDDEVEPHHQEERAGEGGDQEHLGPELAEEDALLVEALEPQVVGPEAGHAHGGT